MPIIDHVLTEINFNHILNVQSYNIKAIQQIKRDIAQKLHA